MKIGWTEGRVRQAWRAVLVLALLGAMARFIWCVRADFVLVPRTGQLFDYTVMLERLADFEKTGELYDTSDSTAFDPETVTMFKYPPPHAALLLAMADPQVSVNEKFKEPKLRRQARVAREMRVFRAARPILVLYLAAVLVAYALITAATRPALNRMLLTAAVFINWQPTCESLGGPQVEPLILALLAATLVSWRRCRWFLAGIPIGIAGALKVYPWFVLAAAVVRRRRWGVLLGAAAGATTAFLAAGTLVPLRFTGDYFTRIMPRLGGIAIDPENAGLLGVLLRLVFGFITRMPPSTVRLLSDPWWMTPSTRLAVLLAGAVFLGLLALIAVPTFRALRKLPDQASPRQEVLWLSLVLCLVPALLPTSWMNYQILLLLPLSVGLALAPPIAEDRATWVLLACLAVGGGINSGICRLPVVIIRSLLPLFGWMAILRLLRAEAAGAPAPRASGTGLPVQ